VFASEVNIGSRDENAPKQTARVFLRFHKTVEDSRAFPLSADQDLADFLCRHASQGRPSGISRCSIICFRG
jgi:hypothetical protein